MSERVPEGWTQSRVINFVNVGRGYAFKSSDYRSTGNPIIRVTNISDSNRLDLSNNIVYLTKDRATEFQSYQLKDDDFLLVMVGATIGKYAKVSTQGKSLFLNQNMWRLSVIDKQTQSQKFAIYGLQKVIEEFLRTMQGSAREFLTQKEFGKATLILPPLPEQKKIASILTSVDEVIESTQKQIDKLQDLKKATMNKLLTKGIDHTEFEVSELGKIPKSWEEITIGNALKLKVIKEIQDGNHGAQHPKASDYTESGIPFVMARDLIDGEIDLTNISYIPETIYQKLRIGFAVAGDILLTHKATIGVTAIVKEDTPKVMCTPQVTYYRVGNTSILNNIFLFYWFQSDIFQSELERLSGQSTRSYIGITAQKDLFLRLPPIDEQHKIIDIFKSIDQTLYLKKKKFAQTQSLKKSLMQDLLTGKVRVQVK